MANSDSCLYWIRLPQHTDVMSQGYIGVASNGANRRWSSHSIRARNGSSLPVHRAIRKHSDIVYEVLVYGSAEYCLCLERKLRPVPNVGWNVAVGGETPPTFGTNMPQETKEKIAATKRGKPVSQAALSAAIVFLRSAPPWRQPSSNKAVWLIADKIYNYIVENPHASHQQVSRHFDFKRGASEVICKKIKTGWTPYEDEEWLAFSCTKSS